MSARGNGDGWKTLLEMVVGPDAAVAEVFCPGTSSDWYIFRVPSDVAPVKARLSSGANVPVHVWRVSRVGEEVAPVAEGVIEDVRDTLGRLYARAWLLLRVRRGAECSWYSAQDDEEFEEALAAAVPGAHVAAWTTEQLWTIRPDLSFQA